MTTYTNIPQDITKLKDEKMDKNNNLSDLADRAAAWLNVRPIGSTPLAGDPVGDYDAATKRWVENKINTGTVGPTMNGVMNYGVGDFHLRDSRAYIQPYEVVSDGQLLNRADWPELWAYAQMVGAIDDSVWLADKFQRGRYSLGDGTTTFRVPDRNGVQQGSIRALYGRGDGGNSGANGQLFESAAPNITAAVPSYSGGSYAQVFGSAASGAFFVDNAIFPNGDGDAIPSTGNIAVAGRYNTLNFDASRSSPIYGASRDEILTRNFVGVWVIRASGGFVAANTSWSVINGDATSPSNGVMAYGGAVRSVYNIAGAEAYVSQLRTKILFGTDFYSALEVKGQEGTLREVMSVNSIGVVTVPGRGGFFVGNTGEPNAIEFFNVTPSSEGNTYVNIIRGHWYDDRWEFGGIREGNTQFRAVQLNINRAVGGNKYWAFKWENSCIDTNLGLIQPGGSDRRLKDKITDTTNTEGNTPRDRINRLVAREFEWLSDGRKDRGFVAQEAKEADEIYAFSGSMSGMLNLNDRAILADIVAVVQEQDRELAEMKAELAELRELVNLMVQK
ncbi:tail fiber protein [Escherichia phage vB_EcoS_ESCO40]|uniref:Tail fiber protein n=1 Tax=Escherichia phage vB_EcoS_ESCO40 TaxID=2918880 RepID=A0AAE9KVZ7_9CAUD|nr:tail fiber protein [Escherichia phage vB_EcoS_ESCO40]